MLPLFLNIQNRLCVVVGCGSVGRRKAQTLLDAGAQVRIVSLESHPNDFFICSVPNQLEWIQESYRSEHLEGASLVFAATNPPLNTQIVADAQAKGIWVNSSDNPEEGDFFVPALLRQGDLLIAISTEGSAPSLARRIREYLEPFFDEAFAYWLDLLREIRPLILEGVSNPQRRRDLFEALTDWNWLDRLRQRDLLTVRQEMITLVQTYLDH